MPAWSGTLGRAATITGVHQLSLNARTDLDAIWDYLFDETGSKTIADRQIFSITARFRLLAVHPKLGRARDADLGSDSRSYPIDQYIIVYRIIGADVLILRVAHGKRNLKALMYFREGA